MKFNISTGKGGGLGNELIFIICQFQKLEAHVKF